MNSYGLSPKFRLNRPLKLEEIAQRLHQKERLDIPTEKLGPYLNVIKINSTYLELTDSYFSAKGLNSFLAIAGLAMFTYLTVPFAVTVITLDRDFTAKLIGMSGIFVVILLCVFLLYMIKKDSFQQTHYPIRFNRKTRMVFAQRVDGSVISAPWDEIFFTQALGIFKTRMSDYYLSGHVLSDDRQTIIDTFCLPESDPVKEDLLLHWEFIRRYMEEGVEPVIDTIKYYLPIENRKETPKESLIYLLALLRRFPLVILVIFAITDSPIWLTRCFAMRFSSLPHWPEEIEAQCQIEADDPYSRDARNNEGQLWKGWLFKGY